MRRTYVLRTYGVSLEQLEKLLFEQVGTCAICLTPWKACVPAKMTLYESTFLNHLCVDHNHATGAVRGLLCNACNTALGLFCDDPGRLQRAITYLAIEP